MAQGEADGQIAVLRSGEVDAASVDGDTIAHGVHEFYTNINYATGDYILNKAVPNRFS